jgi:PmbA protein
MNENLRSVASDIVDKARALGADEADAYVRTGVESTVSVRRQELEKLIEAGSRYVSIRVIKDKRTAVCNTTDLTPRALDEMVRTAIELAHISEPDEYAGLPDRADLASDDGAALQLFDERIESLTVDEMKDIVLRAEQAAFDHDSRITNSEGAEFGAERGMLVLANSLGFCGSYPYTAASFSVQVIADDADGKKRNDYWFSAERMLHRLEAPEDVGRRAAARTVRKLGARKVATRQAPVVFDPTMAGAFAGAIASAASGEALYRRATFLAESEGEQVAPASLSIISDALLPGRLGSRPFDGEGVRTRRNAVVEAGTFRQFLFDSYSARRTGRQTTGSASRSGDAISIGGGNLMVEPGTASPDDIIAGVDDGFYLTSLMGFGTNLTTGDFSRGAEGIWIERGALAYPVSEVNVSGNLREMLRDIDAVGSDAQWRGSTSAPTLRIAGMMVSGL